MFFSSERQLQVGDYVNIRITDMLTYTVGLRPAEELDNMVSTIMDGGVVESTPDPLRLTTDQLMNLDLRLIHSTDYYARNDEHNVWEDRSGEEGWMENLYENAEKLTVVGIVAPKDGVAATALSPGFAYLPSLTQHIIDHAAESEIVKSQLADREVDVFSGSRFDADEDEENGLDFQNMITIDQAALSRAFGGGSVPDMSSMMQNMQMPESTVDPAVAQTDLLTALGRLGRGMLQSFVAQNGEGAVLTADMAESLAANYLASGAAASDLAHLKSTYPLPESALSQMFQPMLAGLVTSYVAAASQPTLPPDFDISDLPAGIDPSMLENMDPAMLAQLMQQYGMGGNASGGAPITSGAIDTAVSQYTGSAAITAAAGQMAQQLSQAAAQAQMAQSMGDMMQQMASAMQVDPAALAQAFRFNMTQDDLTRLMQALARGNSATTAAGNLQQLGYADVSEPAQISVFLKDFEGKEVGLGEYQLTIDKVEGGNREKGFNGRGRVKWELPVGTAMVHVKFDTLRINTDDVAIGGLASTYAGPTMSNYEAVENIFSDLGLEDMLVEAGVPYAEKLEGAAKKTISDKIDGLANYYSLVKSSQGIYDLLTGGTTDIYMPICLPKEKVSQLNSSPVDIQITTMKFAPTWATMSATSSTVAPPVPKPVEVFTKVGFTSRAISQRRIFSSSVR